MEKKRCFITGANSGIGKQAAIQMAIAGWDVYIGARSRERGEKALSEIKQLSGSGDVWLVKIDLSSQTSIRNAAMVLCQQIESLDVLIHNAADFDITRKERVLSVDGIETIWATNHIGPVLLTELVLERLMSSSQGRVITIASRGLTSFPWLTIDMCDPEFDQKKYSIPKAYYQSKLAQVMYTYWLAKRLKDTSITANCIRVTNVKVDIDRYPGLSSFTRFLYRIKSRFSISPEEMAKTYVYLATSPAVKKVTGAYFDETNKRVDSSSYSKNPQHIDELMKMTMKYIIE